MANVYVNLPMPAGNGAGASVNTAAMGAFKTIICGGTLNRAGVQVQVSTDGGTTWAPIWTFQQGRIGKVNIFVSCNQMRVFVSNRTPGFSANVDAGADDLAPDFDVLNVPAFGTFFGTPLDVSAYGRYLTIICGGLLGPAIVEIQGSEDGTSYAAIATFQNNASRICQVNCVVKWLRVKVTGRVSLIPFSGTVSFGASLFDIGSIPITPPPAGGTPKSYLPERWAQMDVPGTQVPTDMGTLVSQLFEDFKVDRDGSLIGIVIRFSSALTGGTATAEVTINGVGSGLSVTISSGSDEEYVVEPIGNIPFVAGDLIGVTLETTAMTPADSNACEVSVEIASS